MKKIKRIIGKTRYNSYRYRRKRICPSLSFFDFSFRENIIKREKDSLRGGIDTCIRVMETFFQFLVVSSFFFNHNFVIVRIDIVMDLLSGEVILGR